METQIKIAKAHWHRMTPGLVKVFIKFAMAVKTKNKNEIHFLRDLELDHSEYNNAQKLRYFALIAKLKENGEHKRGWWVITRRGGDFLRNETFIPLKIMTLNNKIVRKSEAVCRITDFIRSYDDAYWQTEFGSLNLSQQALL